MLRRSLTGVGVLGLVSAGVLLTGGTASAAPAPRPPAVCNAAVLSRDMPLAWLPRSARDRGKRLTWAQVSRWDGNHDGQLSDGEVRAFENAAVRLPGGPNCAVPVPQAPPPPPPAWGRHR